MPCQGLPQNYAIQCLLVIDNLLKYNLKNKDSLRTYVTMSNVLSNLCISFEVYNFFHVILQLILVRWPRDILLFICYYDRRSDILEIISLWIRRLHPEAFQTFLYSLMLRVWSVAMENYRSSSIITPFISGKPNLQSP